MTAKCKLTYDSSTFARSTRCGPSLQSILADSAVYSTRPHVHALSSALMKTREAVPHLVTNCVFQQSMVTYDYKNVSSSRLPRGLYGMFWHGTMSCMYCTVHVHVYLELASNTVHMRQPLLLDYPDLVPSTSRMPRRPFAGTLATRHGKTILISVLGVLPRTRAVHGILHEMHTFQWSIADKQDEQNALLSTRLHKRRASLTW